MYPILISISMKIGSYMYHSKTKIQEHDILLIIL